MYKIVTKAIRAEDIDKNIFTDKQLKQISEGEVNISGLRWHYYQVEGEI